LVAFCSNHAECRWAQRLTQFRKISETLNKTPTFNRNNASKIKAESSLQLHVVHAVFVSRRTTSDSLNSRREGKNWRYFERNVQFESRLNDLS
jgi:hypothetical protein